MQKLIGLTLLLAVCGALLTPAARASCIPLSAPEKWARADVIFDGVAIDGPTATGVQRFRVSKFVKGRGPGIVRVQTGLIRRVDGSGSTTSVSLDVMRGEGWRIFGRGAARNVLQTNQCDGSRQKR